MKNVIWFLLLFFAMKYAISASIDIAEKNCMKSAKEIFLEKLEKRYFIRFPRVVLSQMWHETGGFKSKIYKENHNPFGMKWNNRGYALGVLHGHARYSNIWDAIQDYSDWQAKYCPKGISSEQEYIDWLIRFGYAEDTLYRKHITKTLNTLVQ